MENKKIKQKSIYQCKSIAEIENEINFIINKVKQISELATSLKFNAIIEEYRASFDWFLNPIKSEGRKNDE